MSSETIVVSAGVAYTIASGRLFAPMPEVQRTCEALLGRPVFTHEFADPETWTALRATLEALLVMEAAEGVRREA